MTDELKRALDSFWRASEQRSWILGRMGHPDGRIRVSGRQGWAHVRTGPEGLQSVTMAQNLGAPYLYDLPIKMRREGGRLVIYGVDSSGGRLETYRGASQSSGNVAPHTHRIGSGLEYEVEALRLQPGRVRYHSGMQVYINPFRYQLATGAWETWPGGIIDLTANRPASSGQWAWVLVGVDPATNSAVAKAGDAYSYATPLTIDLVDDIDFDGYIPCAAIRVRQDDTALNILGRYQDAHGWFGTRGGGSGGGSSGGIGTRATLERVDTGASLGASDTDVALATNLGSTDETNVSSEFDGSFIAENAIDGNHSSEWASRGDGVNAWIQINFDRTVTLAKIIIRDRANTTDNWGAGTVTFSDASTQAHTAPPTTGGELEITIDPPKSTDSIRFDQTSGGAGNNRGLATIEAYETRRAVAVTGLQGGQIVKLYNTSDVEQESVTAGWDETRVIVDLPSTPFNGYLTVTEADGSTLLATSRTYADIDRGDVFALEIYAGNVSTSDDDVSSPPTDAELDAAFGTPATVGDGFVGLLDDNGAGASVYLVASDGTNWWYTALTKAT